MLLAIVAVASARSMPARAQATQPVEPQLYVSFKVTMTPDTDARALGAVPVPNQVAMPRGLLQDRFTGGGCLPGLFAPVGPVEMRWPTKGDAIAFEATCVSAPSSASSQQGDGDGRIEWRGVLQGGTISGDVWVTLPGNPLTGEQIAARKRADRDEARRRVPPVTVNGRVVNEPVRDEAARAADERNALLPAQGRRLHFTFATTEVVVVPLGSWGGSRPATRPAGR